jgi:hypothetical protein
MNKYTKSLKSIKIFLLGVYKYMHGVGWVANCFQNLCASDFSFPYCSQISATAYSVGQEVNSVTDEVHRLLRYDALQYFRSLPPHPPVLITVVRAIMTKTGNWRNDTRPVARPWTRWLQRLPLRMQYTHIRIQNVPGGMCQTSGDCSLC